MNPGKRFLVGVICTALAGLILCASGTSRATASVLWHTDLVSQSTHGTHGDSWSRDPAISGDGRWVAFMSYSTNLVDEATFNTNHYLYLRDLQTGTTRLLTQSDGTGILTHIWPALSADGRYLAFVSESAKIVPDDTNGTWDVFVLDRDTDGDGVFDEGGSVHFKRVSVSSDGAQGSRSGDSAIPESVSMSADGRYVAFHSRLDNLVPGDGDYADVFVHDMQTGDTLRMSEAEDGTPGNGFSVYPSISADGRFVLFSSHSSNLVPGDTNEAVSLYDVFLRDRDSDGDGIFDEVDGVTMRRVSVSSAGVEANNFSGLDTRPVISGDGRFAVFGSLASNLVEGDNPSLHDVFLHDRLTGETIRISENEAGEAANGDSAGITISQDGRYLAFSSGATNLVTGDTNGVGDLYMKDLLTNEMTRISMTSTGEEANGGTGSFQFSSDGSMIVFASSADNWVPGDINESGDIFVAWREVVLDRFVYLPVTTR